MTHSTSELSARGKAPVIVETGPDFPKRLEASHKLWSSSLFLNPDLEGHLSHVCREHEVVTPPEAPGCVSLQVTRAQTASRAGFSVACWSKR